MWIIRDQMNPINKPAYCGYPEQIIIRNQPCFPFCFFMPICNV